MLSRLLCSKFVVIVDQKEYNYLVKVPSKLLVKLRQVKTSAILAALRRVSNSAHISYNLYFTDCHEYGIKSDLDMR